MAKEPIANIGHATIGRTKSTSRDELGRPIIETVPARRSIVFYDRDGNRVDSPIHPHRAFVKGNKADERKNQIVKDLLEEGFLQEGYCPHMPRELLAVNERPQPSVRAPEGFQGCTGEGEVDPKTGIGGCAHTKRIVALRREEAKKSADLRKRTRSVQMSQANLEAIASAFTPEAIAKAMIASGVATDASGEGKTGRRARPTAET